MADEKQTTAESHKPEADEYKFSDEEYRTSYDTASGGYGSAGYRQKKDFHLPFKINKRILIVLILIVAVFVAYQFVAPKRTKQPKVPTIAPQSVQKPVSTFSDDRITELQQQLSDNSDAINKIHGQFAKMQVNIANVDGVLANLSSTVQHLAGEIEAIKLANRPSHIARMVVKPKTSYHIMAIVPGRAWLRSNHGLIVTVRLGSKLPEYGTIRAINPNNGVVTTSSGFSIRYGRYDT